MTPYRMMFSTGQHVVQFHVNALHAASRALDLRAEYGARECWVHLEAGFYPQPSASYSEGA